MAEQKQARQEPSRWEWITGMLSAVLVVTLVGYMLYDALGRPSTPPRIEMQAGPVVRTGDGWRVEFTAHNRGHETAAGVKVEGELKTGEATVETAEAVLDYVPGGSDRDGGLFFSRDPARHTLELRAHGYQEP